METEDKTLWHRVKCQKCGKEAVEPVFDDLPTPFCEDEVCNGNTDEIEVFMKFIFKNPGIS